MIAYLAGWSGRKDALLGSLAEADGGGARLPVIGWSPRRAPESAARTREAMARAKRQHRGRPARAAKAALIRGQYDWARRYFARHPERVAVCWNGMTGSRFAFMAGARAAGAATLHVELAPLPGRVTLDPAGVNAAASLPRDPAFYRRWAGEARGRGGAAWRALGECLFARPPRRGAGGGADGGGLPDAPFLFVPLQVPGDSQIRLFGGWTGGVAGSVEALAAAARHLPAGWHLRLKEHPSARVRLGARIAALAAESSGRLVLDNATDTFAQVAASRGVVTINSSVGVQAFFFDKPVVVLGEAFFALPGLAEVAEGPARLACLLAGAGELDFDVDLRAAFMSYLDQVYYARTEAGGDGPPRVVAADARAKLAAARAAR